jgi:hypothetical protein
LQGVLAAHRILVEFQFYLAAASAGNSARDNAVLSRTYLVSRLWQSAHKSSSHQRCSSGWAWGTLMVLPIAIATLTPATILNPSLLFRSGLRLTEGGLKSSIHRVSWEQAFLPLPPRLRGTAKLLVDGSAQRIAEGAAAVVLYFWLAGQAGGGTLSAPWLSYLLLAASVAWVGLTMRWFLGVGIGPVRSAANLSLSTSSRAGLLPDCHYPSASQAEEASTAIQRRIAIQDTGVCGRRLGRQIARFTSGRAVYPKLSSLHRPR